MTTPSWQPVVRYQCRARLQSADHAPVTLRRLSRVGLGHDVDARPDADDERHVARRQSPVQPRREPAHPVTDVPVDERRQARRRRRRHRLPAPHGYTTHAWSAAQATRTRLGPDMTTPSSAGSLNNVVTAMRALLRFFYLRGYTATPLAAAAPRTVGWRDRGRRADSTRNTWRFGC